MGEGNQTHQDKNIDYVCLRSSYFCHREMESVVQKLFFCVFPSDTNHILFGKMCNILIKVPIQQQYFKFLSVRVING